MPWFATTRTSFLYYMTPVAPFMAILVAAALCLFAGGVVPRRGWLTAAAAALATAILWASPVGIGARLARSGRSPRRAGEYAGLASAWPSASCIALAVLASSCCRRACARYRPWTAMVVAGLAIGIVVAFIPIVLGFRISPKYFKHIMWFPSWI